MAAAQNITPQQIIESVGRRIGQQTKEFNQKLDEVRSLVIPSTIERSLGTVRRGLEALMDEVNEQGESCIAYCQRQYETPLHDALAEYYFSSGLAFDVPLELPDGTALTSDKKVQRFDRLRLLLLMATERICGATLVKGKLIRNRVDISRVVALHKEDILETSRCHLFLIAKAHALRDFADGLRGHPLGDIKSQHFRALLDEASQLGAKSDVIRRLESRMKEVTEQLEASANEWEQASVLFGRDWYRMTHAAHMEKTDTPLPPPSSVHHHYADCASRYVAGEPFRLKHLGSEASHVS